MALNIFMWFIFVTSSTIVTWIIIMSLWDKFQTNPTITGLDTDFHNWDVPFPGVTVCLHRPFDTVRIKEYVNKTWGESLPEAEVNYFSNFINLISNLSYDNLNELSKYKNAKNLPEKNYRKIIYEVVYRCEDILMDCYWKRNEYECCDGFLPTFTEKGFCYSFNSLNSETTWPWKEDKEPVKLKTFYIHETDTQWTIEFDANVTDNPLSIYIHSAEELPGLEMSPQHIWTKTVSTMFFASRTTYTTEDARQLTAKQRKCVFADEIKLKTSFSYSYWACMSDCRMQAAMDKCSCVPFFYHQVNELRNSLNCPCELGCENTVYEVEKLNNAQDVGYDPIEIGFVSWPMIRYKREVLFGWVDLLVSFGGIAGLFLGFSLLSGVEIIYYFTMRAGCMIYQDSETLINMEEESVEKITPDVDLSLKIIGIHKIPPKKIIEPFVISKPSNKKVYFQIHYLD